MIETEQFGEWVLWFLQHEAEKENDERLWQLFLAKVDGQSFDEWKHEISSGETTETLEDDTKEQIVTESQNILTGFTPDIKNK